MSARSTLLGSLAAMFVVAGASIGLAAPASADIPADIAFANPEPVEAGFGTDWNIPIALLGSSNEDGTRAPLGPEDGTVNVNLSGIAGIYAVLPIQPGGLSYFTQPTDQPLLAPGVYQVSGNFAPAAGSYFDPSTIFAPLQLTISAVSLLPAVVAEYEPGAETPVITASLTGEYVDQNAGSPAGTWSFAVDDEYGTRAFDTEVAQPSGSTEPLRIEISAKLSSGYEYTVTSTFRPVGELSSGIAVSEVADATFTTPTGSFLEVLGGAAPLPLRLAIPLGILVLALAVTVIILAVNVRGLAPATSSASTHPKDPGAIPGDPEHVEIVDMEFVGIEPQRDGPANWSLSDDNGTEGESHDVELSNDEDQPVSDTPAAEDPVEKKD